MRTTLRQLFCVLAVLHLSGCYTYAPAPVTAIEAGDRVRLHVSDQEGERLAGVLGPRIETIVGDVSGRREDQILVTVDGFHTVGGGEIYGASRALTLALSSIASAERRGLDRLRTALFAVAIIAVPALLAGPLGEALFHKGSGNEEPPPPQPR